MKVLVTGASGFIGRRVVAQLVAAGVLVRALVRDARALPGVENISADLEDAEGLRRACRGVDAIVHCAGIAHALDTHGSELDALHRKINFEATVRLGELAAQQGVARLVFLSSVKAAGHDGRAVYDESCPIPPHGAYAQSKRMAEEALLACGQRTGMGVVVLRLAMTYGRGGRGNLERMAAAIRGGWFPPLPRSAAARSLLHVADAVGAIQTALVDPRAAGQRYIVAHPQTYSARQMQDAIRQALGMPALGRGLAPGLLRVAGTLGEGVERLTGRRMPLNREVVSRLLDAECYATARIRNDLGWQARVDLAQGIAEMLGLADIQP